jgi:endonuclease-3 related protein
MLHIYLALLRYHGPVHWWRARDEFEVAVGAILTQNTAWRNVKRALENLGDHLSPRAIAEMPLPELEERVRPAGFYRQKARRLRDFSRFIVKRYGGDMATLLSGDLEGIREELLSLKGIGRETADSILLYAGNRMIMVVDTYTLRLLSRLGYPFTTDKNREYERARTFIESNLPRSVEAYREFHALVVEHAKSLCRPRPVCTDCPLASTCAHADAFLS